ncbi:uncharacterized protein MELLADRAFT_61771 [Melampsora larici-populina 98AG31]|uniref:Uncharacterized protein n=1 Tax=Melampsora larici-populina (strain 98AG31 / pathotype 3-4-7) TaxID=747676 RepID=F4RGD4_MELLP|nr:uncharacterized protein MELLADRAFT_61771 [Melampsora larici-populina 98AG31]EGG08486.1 hypothetical protein MELLADRAFT_61771 [Melampsora larici-populina 98AG31]
MVNIFSFVPEHPQNDLSGTVKNANKLQFSTRITPYAAFFQQCKAVRDRTKNQEIKSLTEKVEFMISTLTPTFESWGDWLKRHRDTVNEFIQVAYQAFDSDMSPNHKERIWIVGILSAISTHMPPDHKTKMTIEEKIGKIPWTNQVILEIQATKAFEPLMTKQFESLWLRHEHISADEGSKDAEELLERSDMFGFFDTAKEELIPCRLTTIYKLISKHLMKSKLPEDVNEILELIHDLKDFFKTTYLPEWEGRYCEAILRHILKHSSQTQNLFSNLLQDYEFFRQIHFPFAKKDMIEYLQEEIGMNVVEGYITNIKGWKEDVNSRGVSADAQSVYEDPFYVQEAVRHWAVTKMKHAEEPNILELGKYLDSWPDDNKGDSVSKSYEKVVETLTTLQNTKTSNEVYEMSLEFIYNLVGFKSGGASEFVHMMKASRDFRTIIQKAVKKVKRMRKIPPLVDRTLPVSASGFNHFLQILGDILDNDQLNQEQKDVSIEQVTKQLKFKSHDFHLIIGGQPVSFHFKEHDVKEGKKQLSSIWV